MILRKLAEAISKQNWFVVVLEILVVVIGIFIGLQVDDWNEMRKDRNDGRIFMERLHGDIQLTEELSARVRDRRIALIHDLVGAGKVIFEVSNRSELSNEQCFALATSHYVNINISDLPSLTELMSAGRVEIIADRDLRTALVELQQKSEALRRIIGAGAVGANNLPLIRPGLIRSSPIFDERLGEMQGVYHCDLAAMRADDLFLNAASENIDYYDAYLRDGLVPWSTQLDRTHELLDNQLGIKHTNIAAE